MRLFVPLAAGFVWSGLVRQRIQEAGAPMINSGDDLWRKSGVPWGRT